MLASVRDRFTEGFESADLLAATALVDSLARHEAGPRGDTAGR
jgi:hypothetical protein